MSFQPNNICPQAEGSVFNPLDKHLLLPRIFRSNLQLPLTLEDTFYRKMWHAFASLSTFSKQTKRLRLVFKRDYNADAVFLEIHTLRHKGLRLAHYGYLMQRTSGLDSPRDPVSTQEHSEVGASTFFLLHK